MGRFLMHIHALCKETPGEQITVTVKNTIAYAEERTSEIQSSTVPLVHNGGVHSDMIRFYSGKNQNW